MTTNSSIHLLEPHHDQHHPRHPQGKRHWTEVANGYLDLPQWGPPPWTELQWVTLRNVIQMAEDN